MEMEYIILNKENDVHFESSLLVTTLCVRVRQSSPHLLVGIVSVGVPGELQGRGVPSHGRLLALVDGRRGRGQAQTLQQLPHPARPGHGLGLLQDLDLGQGDAPDDQSPLPDLLVELLHDLVGTGGLLPGQLTNLNRDLYKAELAGLVLHVSWPGVAPEQSCRGT